jgi:hypothetical protein
MSTAQRWLNPFSIQPIAKKHSRSLKIHSSLRRHMTYLAYASIRQSILTWHCIDEKFQIQTLDKTKPLFPLAWVTQKMLHTTVLAMGPLLYLWL